MGGGIKEAAETFGKLTGRQPEYLFMRQPPGKVETVFGMNVIQAEWVPEGFAALWARKLEGSSVEDGGEK
jgi:hypothetical protein